MLALATALLGCSTDWTRVRSESGRFEVDLPGPARAARFKLNVSGETLQLIGFGGPAERPSYVPFVTPSLPPTVSVACGDLGVLDSEARQGLLVEIVASYSSLVDGRVRELAPRRQISLSGCEGTRLEFGEQEARLAAYLCLMPDRVCLVQVDGTREDMNGEVVRRVLRSFRPSP